MGLPSAFFHVIVPIAVEELSGTTGGSYDARRAKCSTVEGQAGEVGADAAGQHLGTVERVRDAGLPLQGRQEPREAWAVLPAQLHGRRQKFDHVHQKNIKIWPKPSCDFSDSPKSGCCLKHSLVRRREESTTNRRMVTLRSSVVFPQTVLECSRRMF